MDNELTMFLEASNRISGFTEQIKSPGFIGTVFAPTDDAIQAALDTAGVTKDQLFRNNSLLVDIVQYHVVPGDAISSERLKDDGVYTSMRGKQLTITKRWGSETGEAGAACNSLLCMMNWLRIIMLGKQLLANRTQPYSSSKKVHCSWFAHRTLCMHGLELTVRT